MGDSSATIFESEDVLYRRRSNQPAAIWPKKANIAAPPTTPTTQNTDRAREAKIEQVNRTHLPQYAHLICTLNM